MLKRECCDLDYRHPALSVAFKSGNLRFMLKRKLDIIEAMD